MKASIRSVKRMIPKTEAKDNCQPASNNCVGRMMSSRMIAARDSVLIGLACRRSKIDVQNTQQIIAARTVGALGGTISRKTPTAMAQIAARTGFIKPMVLQNHQMIPTRIPRCIPDRLIRCSKPVRRKAL